MTDDRTCNTSNIPTQKTYPSLLQLVITLLGLAERFVDLVHRLLKRRKFAHGIRDLTGPEGCDTLVQSRDTFFLDDLAPSLAQIVGVCGHGGLHAHFDRFEGTQENVGDELGGRACAKVHERAVGVREQVVTILVLEDLVEAILAEALERVANEGRCPAKEDAAQAVTGENGTPGLEIRGVQFRIDLSTGFDQIKRCDESMGWTAGNYAAEHACCEVFGLYIEVSADGLPLIVATSFDSASSRASERGYIPSLAQSSQKAVISVCPLKEASAKSKL